MVSGEVWLIVVVLAVGAWLWAVKTKKSASVDLTDKDLSFASEAVRASLESLGYGVQFERGEPQSNAIEAYDRGRDAVFQGGVTYAIAVSVVAAGIAAQYVQSNKRNQEVAGRLLIHINGLIAEEFALDSAELWDKRNKYMGALKTARHLTEQAAIKGFSFPRELDLCRMMVVLARDFSRAA